MGRPMGLRKRRMKIHSAVISELDLKILRVLADSEFASFVSISECIRQAVHEFVDREMIHLLGKTKLTKKREKLEDYLRENGIKIIGEA